MNTPERQSKLAERQFQELEAIELVHGLVLTSAQFLEALEPAGVNITSIRKMRDQRIRILKPDHAPSRTNEYVYKMDHIRLAYEGKYLFDHQVYGETWEDTANWWNYHVRKLRTQKLLYTIYHHADGQTVVRNLYRQYRNLPRVVST